jgi:hypothetical protein
MSFTSFQIRIIAYFKDFLNELHSTNPEINRKRKVNPVLTAFVEKALQRS